MLYKDAANAKSNQQHLGTIRGSNLCTEILEYTAPDEVAVCNLASIALPRFVRRGAAEAAAAAAAAAADATTPTADGAEAADAAAAAAAVEVDVESLYDFEGLHEVTKFVAKSLDRVISATHYPLPEAERSNTRHRPVGSSSRRCIAGARARLAVIFPLF